jgi:hypothetical protein
LQSTTVKPAASVGGIDALSFRGADIAAATSINLETATGNLIDVTGNTDISTIILSEGHERTVRFTGTPGIINGSSLINIGGKDIKVVAGDFAQFRGYASNVVRMVDYVRSANPPVQDVHGADIASAATLNLETATGDLVDVTGITTITAVTLSEGHERTVRFTGILTLTNGASLVNITGANIATAAGDFAKFRGYAAGVVRMISYTRADGTPIGAAATVRPYIYAAPFDALAFNGMQVNGSMEASQENGTTEVTLVIDTPKYVVDMVNGLYVHGAATAVIKGQQVTPPGAPSFGAAFQSAVQLKSSTALASPAATDFVWFQHKIEGYRFARCAFGGAAAQSVTIGFWIYATIAGTFTVALQNSARNRSYVTTVTVNSATTWEFKVVTIPGDQSGTWLTTNGIGAIVIIGGYTGSTYQTAAGAWTAGLFVGAAGNTNFFASNNNVICVTGLVVLPGIELPSSARSPLIMRPFAQEEWECQRYFWNPSILPGVGIANSPNSVARFTSKLPRRMRTAPTLILSGAVTLSDIVAVNNDISSIGSNTSSADASQFDATMASSTFTTNRSIWAVGGSGTLKHDARL